MGDPRLTGYPDDASRLPGLTIPGLANCHSHAFHRALRGRTQRDRGTFWTWRDQMYDVAARLDPDTYLDLATATYREMVAAGITSVGEFHYLHHQPDGTPYDDPNEMGLALIEAARRAGLRITLLDTCYLSSGFGKPPEGPQVRFSDGDVDAWVDRVDAIGAHDHARIGGAYHSVRAVPLDQMKRSHGIPAPHPSLRADGRERTVPRGVRHDADAGLRRGRAPDAGQHPGPRHAPHRRRHPADRRRRHLHLLLPDDRARPRRRDRPEPRAARGRQPAHARQRQPCGHRPVRGDASGRARRAAGHAGARALDRPGAARGRAPGTTPSAGATPASSRSVSAPTWSRSPRTACGPPGPAPTSTPSCTPPSPRTSSTSWSTVASCSARAIGSSSVATWTDVIGRIWP